MIYYLTTDMEPLLIENFPFDKYEVETCTFTPTLLAKGQTACWQVFIQNSFKKDGRGFPFGYLKSNSAGTAVNLYVCPYNYPQLHPLLSELLKNPKTFNNLKWQKDLENYLLTVPSYYVQPLKNAMKKFLPQGTPLDRIEGGIPYQVAEELKKLKVKAKGEADKFHPPKRGQSKSADLDPQKAPFKNAFDLNRDQLFDGVMKMRQFIQKNSTPKRHDQDGEDESLDPTLTSFVNNCALLST